MMTNVCHKKGPSQHTVILEFKDISVAFSSCSNFVKDNNILFDCGKKEDFALVFDEQKRCKQVYDRIKCKKRESDNSSQVIENRFLIPLLNDIRASNSSRIKDIISYWIHTQEDEKRQTYLQLLKKYNVYDILYPVNSPQRKQINDSQRLFNLQRKRKHSEDNNTNGDKTLDSDGDSNILIPQKKQKLSIEYKNEIEPENFKLIYFKHKKYLRRGLLLFTSSEKTLCYDCSWNYKEKRFFCRGCRVKCHHNSAIIIANKNDGNESVKVENVIHICKPVSYDQEYYVEPKVIKKPKYEILEKCTRKSEKMLIIFHPNDKRKCYEYSNYSGTERYHCRGCIFKNKQTIAEICFKNVENECVLLLNEEDHICEMRKYDAKKHYQSKTFVLSPDFKILSKIKDGTERKTLIIFDKNDRNLCYTYFYCSNGGYYLCSGCRQKQKTVMARMYENAEDEKYIVLSNAEHICTLRPYIREKEIILRSPNIEFMETTQKGTPKLFIFTTKTRKCCHTFSPIFGDNKMNKYYCLGCEQKETNKKIMKSMDGRMLKGVVTVFLCKNDDNGEFYVRMVDGQKHICEAKKYEPEKYEVEILINPSEFILFREKGKKPGSMNLAIYHPDDKSLCYKFYYSSAFKSFRCFGCEKKGFRVAAKLQKNEDGIEYITVKQKKHLCSPIKISSIQKPGTVILKESGLSLKSPTSKNEKKVDESKIVRSPNFEFQKNKSGAPEGKLIIFKKDDKSQCYSYHFNNCSKYYFCSICKNKNISVTAKLHNNDGENGEKYLVLGSREHLCQPMKYEAEKESIKAPNFMVLKKNNKLKNLIVFTSTEKDICYKYNFNENAKCFRCMFCNSKGRRVSAKLFKDKNGEEYVQLQKNDHICSPQKYVNFENPKIVSKSDFKLISDQHGKPNSKLFLFDSKKKDYVYEYYLTEKNHFVCSNCKQNDENDVTAELMENENRKKYLKLSTTEHICEMIKYESQKYMPCKKIVKDNFVLQYNNSGEPDARITLFNENDKNFGYEYFLKKNVNLFYCCGCNNEKQKYSSIKLINDEKNGKRSIVFGKQEHCCAIRNFKEKNRIFEDFELKENGKVIETKHLTAKNWYYKLNFDEKLDTFYCIKCREKQKKSKLVTANICKDDKNGKEFVFLNDFHCCVSFKK